MRRTHGLLTIALLFFGVAPAFCQVSDAQIVNGAYPTELLESQDADAPSHFSAFVTADLNRSGETLLVALYTNGTRAAVSVINHGGQVISHPDSHSLKGFQGELELIDLDADGIPEIIARLYSGHGTTIPDTWIYAWRNGQLTLISPIQRVHSLDITLLSQIAVVDLDGSGKLAILAFPGVRRDDDGHVVPTGDGAIYALTNGRLAATSQRFQYAQGVFRHAGTPKPAVSRFSASPAEATLKIINPATPGGISVDSAEITLNGNTVAGPSVFKSRTRVVTIPVQLVADNHLSVQLQAKPGGGIWILITK